ncbi:MAG: phosphoserine phosphatase SerB [Mesorhizobium amorphae]|nr:MAG: phosphoserine phosphatase SerB [Mesorhizobium amorphae]
MTFVAILIAHPDSSVLTQVLARNAQAALGASAPHWLSEGEACEFALPSGLRNAEAEHALRSVVDGAPIDVAVISAANRRKRLLIADMDSTIIGQECIDELADEVGLKEKVASITERAMRGEIAFEPALRERVALLAGLEETVIARILDQRIHLASGARALVATMRASGAWTMLVSGGFEAFTKPIATRVGFDEQQANRLLTENGHLSGQVAEPILGRAAKAAALDAAVKRLGLDPKDTLAVGDGANDLDMIGAAGLGVAIHAKPAVAQAAPVRIDHGDLTALLFLQGYRRSDFRA